MENDELQSGFLAEHEFINYFRNFRHDETDSLSLSDDTVWNIVEDHAGYLWIGTQMNGAFRFDPRRSTFAEHYKNVAHEFRTPLTVILGMAQQIN